MGIFLKVGSSLVNTTKKIVSFDRHVQNISWIKGMAKASLVPKEKYSLNEMKSRIQLPSNREAFKQAAQKYNISAKMSHKIWKASVRQAYVGFIAFSLTIIFMIGQFSLFNFIPSVVIGGLFAMMFFKGSYTAYQHNNQVLFGIREFLHSPLSWLPDPVFHPLERGGNSKA